jgi:NADPH-dependent glutamate synthase beta subunit-like oxidoreductase
VTRDFAVLTTKFTGENGQVKKLHCARADAKFQPIPGTEFELDADHVLLAMGAANDRARSSLRFSLGHNSTAADVDALVEAIGPVVERARRVGTTTPAATVGTA